jgi:predicted transcriptional regulator
MGLALSTAAFGFNSHLQPFTASMTFVIQPILRSKVNEGVVMSRITARLEPEYMQKLEVLKNQQHKSITQVLKQAIDEYYANHVSASAIQREALLSGGFIGCAEGGEDLSESYKKHLAES